MKINNDFYPYPILSDFNDDYLGSSISVDYNSRIKGFQTNVIDVELNIEDDQIENMLVNGRAEIVLHIECSSTAYREIYIIDNEERYIEIEIDKRYMIGNIELNTLIILKEDMKIYMNKNFNPIYYGNDYVVNDLKRGNILAATLTQTINIPYNNDDFEQVSSVINVGESKDDFMDVNIDGDIVIVKLPKKEYERYYRYSNTIYSELIMSSTILPSLIYILDMMKGMNDSIDKNLTWYRVISEKLMEKNIHIEDINLSYTSVELAQMILEDPLKRALENLDKEVEGGIL